MAETLFQPAMLDCKLGVSLSVDVHQTARASINSCPIDSYSHSLRGAAMLLSVDDVLLAAVLGPWLCGAAWPLFWVWAGWLWPAWTGFCAWLGLFGGLEASMLLPMLLPSCSRLMCRTTAVALNACWREEGNEKTI